MSIRRVMVVDTHPELRALLISVLAPTCYVVPVSEPTAASDILRLGAFDAVIINMDMPGADPMALSKEASALGCGTILIPDLPSQFNAAAQGGYLILSKPFRCDRLIELVDQACARSQPTPNRHGQASRAAAP